MEERARILLQVEAGIIPGSQMDEYTRQFPLTEKQWKDPTGEEVMKQYGYAIEYMRTLWNPEKVNWVRCDWLYL